MNMLLLRARILEAIASVEIETGPLPYEAKLNAATKIVQNVTGLKGKEAKIIAEKFIEKPSHS